MVSCLEILLHVIGSIIFTWWLKLAAPFQQLSDNSRLLKNVPLLIVVQYVVGLHWCITVPEILKGNVTELCASTKTFQWLQWL